MSFLRGKREGFDTFSKVRKRPGFPLHSLHPRLQLQLQLHYTKFHYYTTLTTLHYSNYSYNFNCADYSTLHHATLHLVTTLITLQHTNRATRHYITPQLQPQVHVNTPQIKLDFLTLYYIIITTTSTL